MHQYSTVQKSILRAYTPGTVRVLVLYSYQGGSCPLVCPRLTYLLVLLPVFSLLSCSCFLQDTRIPSPKRTKYKINGTLPPQPMPPQPPQLLMLV